MNDVPGAKYPRALQLAVVDDFLNALVYEGEVHQNIQVTPADQVFLLAAIWWLWWKIHTFLVWRGIKHRLDLVTQMTILTLKYEVNEYIV